jgi:hypothetical protein
MQKHMGHHHEQLALFALPPNLDGTEEDHEEDELNSLSNNDDAVSDEENIENEVDDMSDASDPDEIADEEQRLMVALEPLKDPSFSENSDQLFSLTADEYNGITYGVGDSEPQIELEAKAGLLSDSLHNDGPPFSDNSDQLFSLTVDEYNGMTYGVGDSESQIELETEAGHLSDSLHNDTDSELGITDLDAQRNYRKKLRERLEELVTPGAPY